MEDTELYLSTHTFRDGARTLSDRTRPLTALGIRSKDGDRLPPELGRAIGLAPAMGGVRKLVIEDIDLGPIGLRSITTSPLLAGLEDLRLLDCDWSSGLGHGLAEGLAGASALRSLRRLDLASVAMGAAGLQVIANSPHLVSLEYLSLHRCDLGDAGVLHLLASGLWPRLTDLGLSMNRISDPGALAIANAPTPPGLRRVYLEENEFSEAGRRALEDGLGRRLVTLPH